MTRIIDPDCRDPFKHGSCTGGPCQCECHGTTPATRTGLPPETIAAMASIMASICERHTPDFANGTVQDLTCRACSLLAGIPVMWPCDERAAVGRLFPDPSNRLLPVLIPQQAPDEAPAIPPDGG